MSGKRNVSVCRGHEIANALYNVLHSKMSDILIAMRTPCVLLYELKIQFIMKEIDINSTV